MTERQICKTISVALLQQQIMRNGLCPFGVVCSNKLWMEMQGDGSSASLQEALVNGQNLGSSSPPGSRREEHVSKIQPR
ncbi:hypothetical protein Tco_1116960 [Tanacetum coccineum]